MNRKKTLAFPMSSFGRFLRGVHASKGETSGFKCKRIKMKSRVQGGVDAYGSSGELDEALKNHQLKLKRVKKMKRSSRLQSGSDASSEEMDGGLKSHRPKLKRVKEMECSARSVQSGADSSGGQRGRALESHRVQGTKVNKKHVSKLQSEVDASRKEMDGGLMSRRIKLKRVKVKKRSASVQSGADASNGKRGRASKSHRVENGIRVIGVASAENEAFHQKQKELRAHLEKVYELSGIEACSVLVAQGENLRHSKMALDYYNTIKSAEFELIKPLHFQTSKLHPPGDDRSSFYYCCHLIFIAKPKTDDSDAAVTKYFFAEMVRKDNEINFNVTSCSTLEPGECGSDHSCLICPPFVMLHPRMDNYVFSCPPYRQVELVWSTWA